MSFQTLSKAIFQQPVRLLLRFWCVSWAVSLLAADPSPDFGFENVTSNGALKGWRVNASAGYPFEVMESVRGDPKFVRGGECSVRLVQSRVDDAGKPLPGHLYLDTDIPVKAGTRYHFSYWAKGQGTAGAWAYFYHKVNGVSASKSSASLATVSREESDGSSSHYSLEGETEWKKCRFLCVVPAGDEVTVRPAIEVHGELWVDDAAFTTEE